MECWWNERRIGRRGEGGRGRGEGGWGEGEEGERGVVDGGVGWVTFKSLTEKNTEAACSNVAFASTIKLKIGLVLVYN